MWWYKLIKYWTFYDLISYLLSIWAITFFVLSFLAISQGQPIILYSTITIPFIVLPFPLIFFLIIQKYSGKIDEISRYPQLFETDFSVNNLKKRGTLIAFFYAEWCPFCRKTFPLLNHLKPDNFKIFRVDISNSGNPLWKMMKIKVVPTIITFKDGIESWRKDGQLLIGLKIQDFKEAERRLMN